MLTTARRRAPRCSAPSTRRPVYTVEHRVIWPDGSVHWVQGRGTVTLDSDGNVTGTIGCASDITASKELELDAARRAAQAEEAVERERDLRQRLEFLAEINRVALAARDHKTLMRAVTAAAVPQLGDWCTLHFMPEPGGTLETEVAHADPKKVEWAVEMRQRFPFDADSPRGVPAVIRTGRLEFIREVTPEVLDLAIEEGGIADRRAEILELAEKLQLTSVITVPLNTKRRTIGAIQFVSAESGRTYDHEDIVLARVGRRAHRRSARQRLAHEPAPLDRHEAAGSAAASAPASCRRARASRLGTGRRARSPKWAATSTTRLRSTSAVGQS